MNSIYRTSYFFNATEYWLQKVQEKHVGLQPWSERDVNDLHTNGGRGETHTIKVSQSVGELSHKETHTNCGSRAWLAALGDAKNFAEKTPSFPFPYLQDPKAQCLQNSTLLK